MTLETLDAVAKLLNTKYGIDASFEYPGFILIESLSKHIAYGDVNEFYGASVTDMDGNDLGYIDTKVSSDSDDVARIAAVTADTYRKYAGVDHVRFSDHDVEFPKFLRDLNFEDESWHNDTHAKAYLYLKQGNEFEGIRVWVDYADPEMREFGYDAPLYVVEYIDGHDEYHCDGEPLYSGDSADDARAAIEECIARVRPVNDARIEAVAEKAMDAFWKVVAESFPQAVAGDFDPMASLHFETECTDAVRLWVGWNVPKAVGK